MQSKPSKIWIRKLLWNSWIIWHRKIFGKCRRKVSKIWPQVCTAITAIKRHYLFLSTTACSTLICYTNSHLSTLHSWLSKIANNIQQNPCIKQCRQTVSIMGSWMTPRNCCLLLRSHITALYASSLNLRSSCRRWLPTSINFCSCPFTSVSHNNQCQTYATPFLPHKLSPCLSEHCQHPRLLKVNQVFPEQ